MLVLCENKMDKSLDRQIKKIKKRKKTQIISIRNEKSDITTDSTGIKRISREYCEKLHANRFDKQNEMNKFLKRHKLLKHL